MRNKILIVGAIAFLAYIVGSRATRVQVDRGESVPHQLVRMWNDPKAKKQREKNVKKAAKKAQKALRDLRK